MTLCKSYTPQTTVKRVNQQVFAAMLGVTEADFKAKKNRTEVVHSCVAVSIKSRHFEDKTKYGRPC